MEPDLVDVLFEEARKAMKIVKNSRVPEVMLNINNDLKLKLYGYYKQATKGPCLLAKPDWWDSLALVKWNAWASKRLISQRDAKIEYIRTAQSIILPLGDKKMHDLVKYNVEKEESLLVAVTNLQEALNNLKSLDEAVNGSKADQPLTSQIRTPFRKLKNHVVAHLKELQTLPPKSVIPRRIFKSTFVWLSLLVFALYIKRKNMFRFIRSCWTKKK